MSSIHFTKSQHLGNDFIFIKDHGREIESSWIQSVCHRKFGVGCDQIFFYHLNDNRLDLKAFNSDASEVGLCGNALIALNKSIPELENFEGLLEVYFKGNERKNLVHITKEETSFDLEIDSKVAQKIHEDLYYVALGNEHLVSFVSSLDTDLLEDAQKLKQSSGKENTNVELVVIEKHAAQDVIASARVCERGAGETLACGSGAMAIGLGLKTKFQQSIKLELSFPGGKVKVKADDEKVTLIGLGEKIAEGELWP